MRQQLLRQITGRALAIMLTLTFTQILASAQEPQDGQDEQLQSAEGSQDEQRSEESRQSSANARKIEGVWEAQVTIRDCQTGDPIITFRVMVMYIRGGSLLVPGNPANPATGLGLGRWQHLGGRHYYSTFRFFLYNPDGSFAGVQRVTRRTTLSRGGDAFTTTATSETFDANDNLIGTDCATETAKRVE